MPFKSETMAWPLTGPLQLAIPAASGTYPSAVQKLLGELFADPEFTAALRVPGG